MPSIKVAIVGGGLAGLTTAYRLHKNLTLPEDFNLEVTIFEATERLGGRVYTLRQFQEQLFAEAGAISITDNEVDILTLMQELGIGSDKRLDRRKGRYFEDGGWSSQSDIKIIMTYLMGQIEALIHDKVITTEDDWISTEFNKCEILEKLDNISIDDFLRDAVESGQLNLNHPHQLHKYVSSSLLGLYAGDTSKLSTFDALRYLSQYKDSHYALSIVNGNESLVAALHEKIKPHCRILTNTAVTMIAQDADKISISTDKSNPEEFDYVVVATSLSLIQSHNKGCIKFSPPLPESKREAVDRVSYNRSIARVYCEMNSRFWNVDSPETAMVFTNEAALWIEDHTAHLHSSEHAVLEAHAAGAVGEKVIESDQAAREGENQIASLYGEGFRKARSSQIPQTFFWSKQPYQQGAYPYFQPGQRKYLAALKENVGNIFFAGEYTSIGHPASMNGAVCSAQRVSDEISAHIQDCSVAPYTKNVYGLH